MLHGNEKIYWQAGPSKLAILLIPRLLVEIIVAVALLHPFILSAMNTFIAVLPLPREIQDIAPFTPAGLVALTALWSFLQESTKKFILTSERLIIRYGVMVRTEDEVELYRVIDAVHTVNVFQRLINVGTVTVTSSDKTGTVAMNSIHAPSKVRNGLRKLAERCKSKRGVRILE